MELRLVGADGQMVAVRAEPETPLRDVAAALQKAFGTEAIPVLNHVPLTGGSAFGDVGVQEASTIAWAPADSVRHELGMVALCVEGPDAGKQWSLSGTEVVVGRDLDCTIAVDDHSSSRRHARISVRPDGLVVEDLDSTNGTMLNDQPLEAPQWLRPGDRVRVGRTLLEIADTAAPPTPLARPHEPPQSPYELCVVGGTLAGQRFPLHGTEGSTVTIGRGPNVDIAIADGLVSAQHLQLAFSGGASMIRDLDSSNGTTLDGFSVNGTFALRPGSIMRVGDQLLAVRAAPVADAVLGPVVEGKRRYDRIARIRSVPPAPTIVLPVEPTTPDKPPFPWPIVIAPVVLSLVMAFVFRRPEALLFSLLTPIMAISTNVSTRRNVGRRAEADAAAFTAAMATAQEQMHNAVFEQKTQQWHEVGDPCAVFDAANGPGARLWERRLSDDDTLRVRVGTAPVASDMRLTGRTDIEAPLVPNAPVSVDLRAAGVTSLAGPAELTRPLARWMVGQLLAMVSPSDLGVGLLTDRNTESAWGSLAWAPHARLGPDNGARVGNDTQSVETRVAALNALVDERQQLREEQRIDSFAPLLLTVIDDSREFRRVPGVIRLLEEGPDVGLLFLTLDTDTNRTPGEANALVAFDRVSPSYFRLAVAGHQPVEAVLGDGVSSDWLLQVAKATAAIEPAAEDAAAQIPTMVRYADLVGLDVDDDAPLAAAWAGGARTCTAVVGASADGPFAVDIAQDGPHAFVAGTTGSGKTELLLTFLAGLALGNRPEALNVIIVDWKGGGDFVELGGLPHTVGMVTNLDGHLAKRALASLQAEVGRRQNALKHLKEAGEIAESNIGSAWQDRPDLAREHGLARLIIVVDEFAELAQSLPEFLAGLIRIARVGRALGIHLVLATQRPRGVISGDLSANVGLRLVLRTESGESREVLESDHADHISRRTRGRGFVRYGDPARLVEFQTARVAGRRPGAVVGLRPPTVNVVTWSDVGYALPQRGGAEDRPDAESTDLRAIVDMTQRVATQLALAPPPSPWLPPLPDQVELAGLTGQPGTLAAPFGLIDEPEQQSQRPILFDLERHGHLAFAGSAGSGRTTALRAVATSVATHVAPADCNLYGFDFGNGGLLGLSVLPHVGAIVRANETDRVVKVLDRLTSEISRRQAVLAQLHAANINDQRALDPDNPLPHIVVLVDRWDSFASQYPLDTEAHQAIIRLARDGLGVGIHLVMSGDRYLLGGRLGGDFERKLMLPFADRDDYRDGGLRPQDLPEVIAPGRAFVADRGAEVQVAQLGGDDSGPALRDYLRNVAEGVRTSGARPASNLIRVEALPASIAFDDVHAALVAPPRGPLDLLIGVGGDDLSPELVDLAESGPGFVIAGPPGTGRSTALVALARSALAQGTQVIAITPRSSPLAELAHASLRKVPVEQIQQAGLSAMAETGPTLLLVDDVHLLNADDGAMLRSVVDNPAGGVPFGFAIAGDIDKLSLLPLAMSARRSGSGLLLSPRNLDRDLLSLAALPPTITGRQPAGRGYLARRSTGREAHVVS